MLGTKWRSWHTGSKDRPDGDLLYTVSASISVTKAVLLRSHIAVRASKMYTAALMF